MEHSKGIKKVAALIRYADAVREEEMQKEAGLRTFLQNTGGRIGNLAKSIAGKGDALGRGAGGRLPVLGGIAGGGLALPLALQDFEEGDVLEGLGTLGLGAGAGVGAGFLGRNLMRSGAANNILRTEAGQSATAMRNLQARAAMLSENVDAASRARSSFHGKAVALKNLAYQLANEGNWARRRGMLRQGIKGINF